MDKNELFEKIQAKSFDTVAGCVVRVDDVDELIDELNDKMKREKFGLVEDKGDNIFLNLGTFDTFEEAVKGKKTKAIFRDKANLIIIQRIDEESK